MPALSGSIQILVKTDAQLAALGSPWIPLAGQWFMASDTGDIGIGDGTTNYSSLVKFNIVSILNRLQVLEDNVIPLG